MSAQITIASDKAGGLMFVAMTTDERLGRMYTYWLQFESKDAEIDLTGLLGSSMTVTIDTQDGYKRYFNGIVCEAAQTGVETIDGLVYAQYSVSLVPKPWLLGGMVDCRIFTDMAVPEIVKAVLNEAGYSDVKLSLSASYAKREYCVQYREDGLNFISRLMEQEGIYYYFTHDASTHTMVLSDGVGSHAVTKEFAKVGYAPGTDSGLRQQPTVTAWACSRGVDSTKCQLTDYNPLTPKASLLSTGTDSGHEPRDTVTVFDFPGAHGSGDVGRHYAQVRAEALGVARSHYSGKTGSCGIEIGGLFTLSGYLRNALNQEYLITAADMQLQGTGHASGAGNDEPTFSCSFEAIESRQPFRSLPTAAKPVVAGLQTALVCGTENGTDEDIVVDKYGRVQVTFHWNQTDKPDAKNSCPVRVASPWAGKSWGAVSIPRIGQEVVVSFLEGDPDRPLIIGSVYNADNMPPYTLPDNKTQSGIKSRSLLGGADDANELRFEDKKGEEQLFIHAQKDMLEEVENDHTVTIDHDEKVTIKNDQTLEVGNDQTETVKHDRKVTVQNDDKLDVSNNGTTSIGQKFKLSAGSEIELVTGSSSIVMKSSGEIEIKGINIKITGSASVKVAGAQISAKADAAMDLGAGATLKAHSDGMLEVAGTAMTTVKGTMTTVKGDAMTQVSGGIIMIG